MITIRLKSGGFWRRVGAVMVDGFVLSIITFPVQMILFSLSLQAQLKGDSGSPLVGIFIMAISYFAYFALLFAYEGYFLSRKGSTPGKMVLGLRVLDDRTGTHISFLRAGLRATVGRLVNIIPLFIGYLLVAVRSDKKGLHDMFFDTHVWLKKS